LAVQVAGLLGAIPRAVSFSG